MLPGVRSSSGGAGAVGSIAELSVRADLRRQGIGRALIARAMEEMRAAGAAEALVTAEADSEAALGAYASCGFKPALRMASFRRLIL
jgi:ribosomal protein S18 acetylase RimI-like enzyme